MPISARTVEMINEEAQKIPIKEERWRELAIELNQLREAAEAAAAEHDFDRDPNEFLPLLRSHRM